MTATPNKGFDITILSMEAIDTLILLTQIHGNAPHRTVQERSSSKGSGMS